MTFELVVQDYKVINFETSFKGSAGFNIDATYESTETKSWVYTTPNPVYQPPSVSATFVAGIPWDLTFSMPIYAGFNATLGAGMALSASASATGSVEYGLKVVDGGPLQYINQHSFTHTGKVSQAIAAASSAEFFIEPRLTMMVDHIGGPLVALRPGLVLSGSPSSGCGGMSFGLSAAIAVAVGVKTDITFAGISIPCSFCHLTDVGKFTTFVNQPITSVCVALPALGTSPTPAPSLLGGPCPLNTYGSSCTPCPSGEIAPGGSPSCTAIVEKIPQDTSGTSGPWVVGQVWSGAFRIISGGPNRGKILPYVSKTADMDLTVTSWDSSTGSLEAAVSHTAVDIGCTAQYHATGTYDASTKSATLTPGTVWYDAAEDASGTCSNMSFPIKNFVLSGSVSADSLTFTGSIPNNGQFVTCDNANLWNRGEMYVAPGGYVTDDDHFPTPPGVSRKKYTEQHGGVLWNTDTCTYGNDDQVAAGIGCTNLPQNLRPFGSLDVCNDCCPVSDDDAISIGGPANNCPGGQGHTAAGAWIGAFSLSRANGGGATASTVTFAQQTCPASSTSSSSSSNEDNDGVSAYNGDGNDDGGYSFAAKNENTGQTNRGAGSAYEFNSAQLAGVIVGSCLAGMLIIVVVLKRDALRARMRGAGYTTGTPAASDSGAPNSNPAYSDEAGKIDAVDDTNAL